MALFGYTKRADGTALSDRASWAEGEGRFSVGNFQKKYSVAKADWDVLVDLDIIYRSEWHHTGKNFNKTDFYSWSDTDVDYSNGIPKGSFADIYQKDKKEIKKINDFEPKVLFLQKLFGCKQAKVNLILKHEAEKRDNIKLFEKKAAELESVKKEKLKLEKAFDKWLNSNMDKGNIWAFSRLTAGELPRIRIETMEEQKGKYGWFAAKWTNLSTRYYSGWGFKSDSFKQKYIDKKKEISHLNLKITEIEFLTEQYKKRNNYGTIKIRFRHL